ncbi:MAG: hypothetical protein WAW17_26970 [Rhodococcus sp. (in: high G+C Gram-positive bacteria)]|uniref:hypothetical protein n=1 Tax=Rhodococcus sp. TaxID=1831 RepID=UPI003BB08778
MMFLAPLFGLVGVLLGALITQWATHRRELWNREESRRNTQRQAVAQALTAINALPPKVKALSRAGGYPMVDPQTKQLNEAGSARHSAAVLDVEAAVSSIDQALRECKMTVWDPAMRPLTNELTLRFDDVVTALHRDEDFRTSDEVTAKLDILIRSMLETSKECETQLAPQMRKPKRKTKVAG